MTTELLGLHPSGVRDEECSVICDELFLQLHGAESIDIFGVVGDNGLGDRLSDGVDLGDVSSSLDTDTDVEDAEGFLASNKDGLVDLEPKDLGLEEVDWGAVNADDTTALLGVGDCSGSLENEGIRCWIGSASGCSNTNLLFAESLNGLDG